MNQIPNWCNNRISVVGDGKRVEEFDSDFRGKRALWPPSEFETRDKKGDCLKEFLDQYKKEWDEEEPSHCFNALYPVPGEVLKVGFSHGTGKISFQRMQEALFVPDKWVDGYSWCVSHWGCKWDVFGQVRDERLSADRFEYEFETAWSPPIAWLKKVAEDWPDLRFDLVYYEPGLEFAGRLCFEGGKVSEDLQLEGDDIREFVVDVFCIDPYEGCEERG